MLYLRLIEVQKMHITYAGLINRKYKTRVKTYEPEREKKYIF